MVEIMEMVWERARTDGLTFDAPKPPKPITAPQSAIEHKLVDEGALTGKTVFVTGATGFLGSNLVGALARCGAKVRALVRDLSTVSPTLEKQATLIKGDVRDTEVIKEAVQGVDIVYHCAAITRNRVRWDVHYDVNVRASEELFKAALAAGVKRVVHVSSVAIYGVRYPIKSGTVHETAPYATDADKWGYYMLSKRDADKLALRYAKEEGLPVSVLRLGILYGPGRRAPGRGLLRMGLARFLIGNGKNRMPYTYISNAVDAVLLASVVPDAVGEAYNIVDEPQVSAHSVTKQNIKMTGAREVVVPIPPLLLGALASFFEWRSNNANANTPPPLTHFVVDSAVRDICYDTGKARTELGWEPEVPLEVGLRATLDSQG